MSGGLALGWLGTCACSSDFAKDEDIAAAGYNLVTYVQCLLVFWAFQIALASVEVLGGSPCACRGSK